LEINSCMSYVVLIAPHTTPSEERTIANKFQSPRNKET